VNCLRGRDRPGGERGQGAAAAATAPHLVPAGRQNGAVGAAEAIEFDPKIYGWNRRVDTIIFGGKGHCDLSNWC
jgi:hypothetical protein